MHRAPGYLGNYEHRPRLAGLGSYGGLGLLQIQQPIKQPVLSPTYKTTSSTTVQASASPAPAPTKTMTVTETMAKVLPTQDATATQLSRQHLDQAIQRFCQIMNRGAVSVPDAMERVRREALEVWAWTPDYANRILTAAGAEVARNATSDFEPWSGCPPPPRAMPEWQKPTTTPKPGIPATSSSSGGGTTSSGGASAPPPAAPPPGPTPTPTEWGPTTEGAAMPWLTDEGWSPSGPASATGAGVASLWQRYGLMASLAVLLAVGAYYATRPKKNPRRRRRRRTR